MQDLIDYALKNGITLQSQGDCQFCGANVAGGVFECHANAHHLVELLDFNNPLFYQTRFLSVDAMALQHSEIHGPWNNHIHLTRLFLIFEKEVQWTYLKTPLLSVVINQYKKNKKEFLTPPPLQHRGNLTTSDLVGLTSTQDCVRLVRQWAMDVYTSYSDHHHLVSLIADTFLTRYH
ncbi:hypothetical protein F5984_19320 [Rudanella paleaurantiibacter]|uniref:Uncharacterized protein n=1 Tax=Rudanella paleaurantiibacter TaxID=2614655 RepID=A0A7J5TUS8_9BACT|nr:DUF5946 family protein [Rudanella paleaurantiibacter]KAB7727918.1 hypothetical protein F5984_19320 [Rudanella paleaurantiibacter]